MTLADMRHFYGDLKDDSDSQKKFRDYLLRDSWRVEHFERWMTEALHEKLATEFQDLVVAFGRKLGFEVEVVLKTGTIRKLVDPIKLGEAFPPVRSRYTTLSKLIEAKDLDELF